MRKVKFAMMILAASLLTACGSSKKEQSVNEETAAARTQETENLLANLKKIPSKGIMLGHHDDTVYGIGWEGEEARSDVKACVATIRLSSALIWESWNLGMPPIWIRFPSIKSGKR